MDSTKCTIFFIFLVLLSVTFMSEASKVPPKPPSYIDPNCHSPGSSLDRYSRANLYPPPSGAASSNHQTRSSKHGVALEAAVSELSGDGDGDGGYGHVNNRKMGMTIAMAPSD